MCPQKKGRLGIGISGIPTNVLRFSSFLLRFLTQAPGITAGGETD
jgi:hypothetical protein